MASPASLNTISTSTLSTATKYLLARFKLANSFIPTAYRDQIVRVFSSTDYKPGYTINIPRRVHFNVFTGEDISSQTRTFTEETVPVTVQEPSSCAYDITAPEQTLKVEGDNENRFLDSMVDELTAKIEADLASLAETSLYLTTGSASSLLNSFASINNVAAFTQKMQIPRDKMYFSTTLSDGAALKNSLQNAFNSTLNDEISFGARLGRLSIFDMFENGAIATHTAGTAATQSTVRVNGVVSSGNTINVDGLTPSDPDAFKAGDIVTFGTSLTSADAVKLVTPLQRLSVNKLATFVVLVGAGSNGSGQATITVAPSIISSTTDPRRNVSQAIPDNAVVTTNASHNINVAYHECGLGFAPIQMAPIVGAANAIETDPETGLSLQLTVQGSNQTLKNTVRLTFMYAAQWFPEYAVRVMSQPTEIFS